MLKRLKIKIGRKIKLLKYNFSWLKIFSTLIGVVILTIAIWFGLNYDAIKKQIIPNATKEETAAATTHINDPNRLEAKSIGLVGRIIYPDTEEKLEKLLDNGINHMPESAVPGDNKNVVLTAHSSSLKAGPYQDIFSNINKLAIGDEISYFKDDVVYKYRVTEGKVISKTDLDFLNNLKNQNSLTLVTCWPIGTDLQRYVVVAKRVE